MLRLSAQCPRCLHQAARAVLTTTSVFARNISRDAAQKKRPSRLVLSSQASVADRKQTRIDDFSAPGTNRTVANIPPRVLRKQLTTSEIDWEAKKKRESKAKSSKAKPPRPMKHMKMQQSLSGVPRNQKMIAYERIASSDSFDDFDLLDSVRDAVLSGVLSDLKTVEPTAVQKLVIPVLMGQETRRSRNKDVQGRKGLESFLIAAETGSGKTLAYALPVIDFLKRQEMEEEAVARQERLDNPHIDNNSDLEIPVVAKDQINGKPRAVIIVPTSELVKQVGDLVGQLSHVVKFRKAVISRELTAKVIKNRMFGGPVDVVVCTPYLLNSLTETNPALFSRCSQIVVDEADSLFDRSFSSITMALIKRCENLKKLILCSATIPRSLDNQLKVLYPDMKRLVTPNLHVVPRRVQLQVVDADSELYRGNKQLACADTLYTIAKDNTEAGFMKKVIVFVNERETTEQLAAYLRTKGIDAIDFARDSQDRTHAEILEFFTSGKDEVLPEVMGKQRMRVLVTTDIASRGVDTKTVKNVILYDKPHSAVDLIHRIGRTGRMGRRGRAVILVDKNTNKGWIKDVKT